MPSILLTSFEPFDGATSNPSQAVAARVVDLVDGVATLTLPVSFVRARAELAAALDEQQPRIALGLGLAANREKITFERLAVNIADARIADNDGSQPGGEEIIAGAEIAMWTNLPVKAALGELGSEDVELSMSAGTYVCNAVFYSLMQWAKERNTLAGFVHVPLCETDAEIEQCAQAVALLLRLSQAGAAEVQIPLGSVS